MTISACRVHPPLLDLAITVQPAEEPVLLTDAKAYLRVDGTDQDDVITALITAERIWAEGYTRRSFVTRTLSAKFSALPSSAETDVYLPGPPLVSLVSGSYDDADGTPVALDVADFEFDELYGLLRPAPDKSWPSTTRGVTFVYTAGYGATAADVPAQVALAVKIAIAQNFELRVDAPVGAQVSRPQSKSSMALLEDFRVYEF